ncbi:uncharacterized protein LOC119785667 [Cyprinodon tularosa]|uniref:uncharacterized protein LOC119785667 n=1 Tax=Cyprinodon tularosa TaxID=77115 RepID=UPI0018E22C49|nr:uncharacterized protein LOC119785667 [Cyprinodon tularosa]
MTNDCRPRLRSNHILKYADDTTVVDLIRDNNEAAYREEVRHLVDWCRGNNLILNVKKTKEIIIDFRKSRPTHTPLLINDSAVEVVSSTKFLGVHITDNLSWSPHIFSLMKKGQQRLHFLSRMKRASLPPPILQTFYRGTIESPLTSYISIWSGSCRASDWKSLQRVLRTGEKITGAPLPCIKNITDRRSPDPHRPQPPQPWTVFPPGVRQKVPQHLLQKDQTTEQFLPPGHHTLNAT